VEQLTADDAKDVERRLAAMPAEERTAQLINGIVRAGLPFVNTMTRLAQLAGNQGLLQEHADECRAIMIHWLMGIRLTDRADEDERRLVLCISFIEQVKQTGEFDRKSIPLLHMASTCILGLPKRHPRRDTALALRLLVDMANWCYANSEAELLVSASSDFLRAIAPVQDQATLDGILALAARAEAALPEVEEIALRRRFRNALGSYLISLAMAARDSQQPKAQVQWIAKATAQLHQLRALQPTDADEIVDLLTMEAVIGELGEDAATAADAYARIRGIVGSASAAAAFPALHEGRLRLKLQEYQAVVDSLQPVLAGFKEAYLLAVETSAVQSAGRDLTNAVSHLAFAQARLGDWDAAIRTADQAKSLRLRHRAAMRATPEGQRLLELEAALYALSRGLPPDGSSYRGNDFPDLLRNEISRESLFREEYRRARPPLAPELVDSPSTQEIAAVLHDDEAVVMLGTSFAGTFLAVIFADDRAQPGAHLVLDDWPSHRLWEIGGTPKTGWMYVLAAPQGYKGLDHRQALALLIERMDQAIGSPLATLLRGRNLSRLTMIMSGWLHAVPWWTLPSLAGYHMSVAPSAAQFVLGRRNPRALARKAVGAADPTLDLPLSVAEVEAMAHHLAPAGFEVATCSRAQATQEKMLALAYNAGIFHFSGHGRSDFFAPTRSALLLYPDLRRFARFGADPLAGLSAQVSVWDVSPFEGRFADLPEIGRLYETGFPEAGALERFLEYGARGTLWARYEGGQMTQMAELWRTGDILVAGAMDRCGLAFLSACESGGSGLDPDIDEPIGLPAALHLAGVSTVIGTLWPVTDVVAVLFADLFYAKLAHSAAMVDLTAVVADIADRLRGLTREEAASLLDDLGRRTVDAKARFRLKAAARLVLAGDEMRPYGDPIAWAAFYVSGSGDHHLDHHSDHSSEHRLGHLGTDGDNGHMAVSQEQSAHG
jgi:CHAT domain-containing protein/tetratricopeptide (TPR) repeat protein